MEVKITRIDKTLPLPQFKTDGSVGFDLYARTDIEVEPNAIARIPANVIIQVPRGYALIIASRSSTPGRLGLTKPHGIGVIDQDYCGPEDEVKIQVFNFTQNPVMVRRGDRIAQGLFVRTDQCTFSETDKTDSETRGGFGSTGKNIDI
jgi:dUTP pyrophosphatase